MSKALLFSLFLSLGSLCLPWRSSATGEPAAVTFAWAWQDRPSGVYVDRAFDWPTGGAVWIDVPVWAIQAGCLAFTLFALFRHVRLVCRGPIHPPG